jgi:hypothetical protein
MARDAARKYDAGAAAFFVENLCQDADTLLRFGFALTLSEEIASRLVYKTYQAIGPRIAELLDKDSNFIRLQLMRRAWELHHEANQEGQSSVHVLFPLLKPLDLETRAVLFMVDVIGLTVEEACEITKMDEGELRRHLAHGRKRLLGFRFE